ncbi:cell filamentation protein Fic [Campylobacter jejuni]|uniref:Fic family protein n=1 Tax=Campylobacter jejuni TaxID=197 RepID=UPI000874094A|nr:Fic family protein [Campylobacter jejuni]OEV62238.1 cell filamentation protein Fic [Campylobacter jejuni]
MCIDNKLEEIDKLKDFLKEYSLPLETKRSLDEDFKLRYTNDSNAIEGNTLTLFETKAVLEGITIAGKSVKEHLETINHSQAIDFMIDLANSNTKLNSFNIKSLHQIILQAIEPKNAGVYRDKDVVINGVKHIPPSHVNVELEMERFLNWYKNEAQELHPVIRASRVHIDFVGIHPFIDGNGRMSRLLLNYELIKNDYPPINIKHSAKVQYFEALEEACYYKNFIRFDEIVINEIKNSLEREIRFLDTCECNLKKRLKYKELL